MFKMKRGTVAAIVSTTAGLTLAFGLSACGGEASDEKSPETVSTVPQKINATNVTQVQVEGLSDEVTVFDIERDGRILTCTTKNSFRAGVSCIPAAKEVAEVAPKG